MSNSNSNNILYTDATNYGAEEEYQHTQLLAQQRSAYYPQLQQTTSTVTSTTPPQQVIVMSQAQPIAKENHSSTALLLCLLGCFIPTIGPIFHIIGCCFYANNEDMDESTRFWGKFSCCALVFYGVMIAVSILLLVVAVGVCIAVPGVLATILAYIHGSPK